MSDSKQPTKQSRVAIVCDWLTGTGGAERVVLELHRLFPEAPIYTSQYNKNPEIWFGEEWFAGADVRTGWLQKLPKSLRKFLPVLRAWYFSRLDLSDYDLVISSSGAEAKFVRTRKRNAKPVVAQDASENRKGGVQEGTSTADHSLQHGDTTGRSGGVGGSADKQAGAIHISYCHSPTHYYWARYEEYLANPGFGRLDPLARLGLKLLVGPMRRLDRRAAGRPDYFIANSRHTAREIKKYYGRQATVIHPPIDVERFSPHNQPADKRHGFITAGRQTPYKRLGLAVEAAVKTGVPLVVVGRGPEHRRLKRLAGRNVTFMTKVNDSRLAELLGGAKAFIFPGVDDFGIVAVEALAAGTPVIAFKGGGALDYVNHTCGLFFDQPTPASLQAALKNFENRRYDHQAVQAQTTKYSAKAFRTNFKKFIKSIHQSNHGADQKA
ncbi:glycosyltransferase [Candidatus Saccharibacteria bacterium]|nr:glycosyltransferase [Candidatus Saccharibacteria bacterium]